MIDQRTDQQAKGWTKAVVGFHWTRGGYSVSTYNTVKERGYIITLDGHELAKVANWQHVERVCDRRGRQQGQERRDNAAR